MTSWLAATPSATSLASTGTVRLTSANAIGPGSWWRAARADEPNGRAVHLNRIAVRRQVLR
jgi:hypothetical protein